MGKVGCECDGTSAPNTGVPASVDESEATPGWLTQPKSRDSRLFDKLLGRADSAPFAKLLEQKVGDVQRLVHATSHRPIGQEAALNTQ